MTYIAVNVLNRRVLIALLPGFQAVQNRDAMCDVIHPFREDGIVQRRLETNNCNIAQKGTSLKQLRLPSSPTNRATTNSNAKKRRSKRQESLRWWRMQIHLFETCPEEISNRFEKDAEARDSRRIRCGVATTDQFEPSASHNVATKVSKTSRVSSWVA